MKEIYVIGKGERGYWKETEKEGWRWVKTNLPIRGSLIG
jgi:hypothetical protein